jgi:hypothetical protein
VRAAELQPYFGKRVKLESIEIEVKQLIKVNTPAALGPPIKLDAATKLVGLALDHCTLWHDPVRRGYATITRDDHVEHYRLGSQGFRTWLSSAYADAHTILLPNGKVLYIYPKPADLNEALGQLEGQARRGECKTPGVRVMKHEGAIWIDSGADDWHGWRVTADKCEPVKVLDAPLIRSDGMLPLPEPEDGKIDELYDFVHFRDD